MDPPLLNSREFWQDSSPIAAGNFPGELPDDLGLYNHILFETSGSLGNPKWIALSKEALLTSAAAVNQHLQVSASSCWGLALPLHHVGGFGVATRAWQAGCRLESHGCRWNPTSFTRWIADQGVTHTSLVPAQVYDLITGGHRAPSAIKAIVVGGGRMDLQTGAAARKHGWPVLASYGMTEACSQIATQNLESLLFPYRLAPIPLLPIWRAHTDSDQRLSISGPALFSGMLVHKNANWLYKPRESEWFQTADQVTLEDVGLTPIGRLDLVIKVLGELVDVETIEQELIDISGGKLRSELFALIPVPDARAEHVLVPVFDADVDRKIISTTLATYQQQAPGFRRLEEAVFLTIVPRSPLGKLLRAEILRQILCG